MVFPGTGYLEAGLAASGKAWDGTAGVLEQVEFREPLLLPEEDICTLQTILSPNGSDASSWRVYSRNGAGWTLHAQGSARPANGAAAGISDSLAALRGRCIEAVSVPDVYEGCAERGIDYGPSFCGLAELYRGRGEALGRVRLTDELRGERGYILHPALLDACLQVCGGVVAAAGGEGTAYLPWGVERLAVYGPATESLWCWARLRPAAAEATPTFDIEIRDDSDKGVVAVVTGLSLRRAERRQAAPAKIDDWLHEVIWEPQGSALLPAEFLTAPSTVATRVAPLATQRLTELAARYPGLEPELEALALDYVIAAFARLAIAAPIGGRVSLSMLMAAGVIERHRRLAERLLAMLGEAGLLQPRGTDWEVVQAFPTVSPPTRLARLLETYPDAQTEATLLARCGEELAAVLRGTTDPLPLLFPAGGGASAETLYRVSPATQAFNAVVAAAVTTAIEALPAGRRLRVLEIGAGTGGTTAAVLPVLAGDRCDYVFSDISAGFLAPAREKFAAHDFVEYQALDIERDPRSQGRPAHGYDLVLAANVLHATTDLHRTLTHVCQLLAPSGVLLLLEGTRPQRWVDLTFGLLEGWWKFADTTLRPTHPLLSASAWQTLLAAEGFTESACIPDSDAAGQVVLLRAAPRC